MCAVAGNVATEYMCWRGSGRGSRREVVEYISAVGEMGRLLALGIGVVCEIFVQ